MIRSGRKAEECLIWMVHEISYEEIVIELKIKQVKWGIYIKFWGRPLESLHTLKNYVWGCTVSKH